MNVKHIIATLSVALAGTAAMAGEATQFEDPVSGYGRTSVASTPAESAQAPTAVVVSNGEATQFFDVPSAPLSREEVRAEARMAARNHTFSDLYGG